MKKPLYKNYFFWIVVVAAIVAAIFFVAGADKRGEQTISDNASGVTPSTEKEQLVKDDGNGYAFNVPSDWYIEQSGDNTVVVYPDYSPSNGFSSTPICKIEMSVFPYATSTDMSDWISKRLGADPTVDVVEQSSENISVGASGSGVKWIGTMNGIATTLVYAFGESHAYEIAPSMVTTSGGEGAPANGACNDSLNTFLQKLTI